MCVISLTFTQDSADNRDKPMWQANVNFFAKSDL